MRPRLSLEPRRQLSESTRHQWQMPHRCRSSQTGNPHRQRLPPVRPQTPRQHGNSTSYGNHRCRSLLSSALPHLGVPSAFCGYRRPENPRPQMERNLCSVEHATLAATSVGVPTMKQRTFVVASKPQPAETTTGAGAKLSTWRQRLEHPGTCLLYTSPSPRDATLSRMPSSA